MNALRIIGSLAAGWLGLSFLLVGITDPEIFVVGVPTFLALIVGAWYLWPSTSWPRNRKAQTA